MLRPKLVFIDDDHDHLLLCRLIFEKQDYAVSVFPGCESISDLLEEIILIGQDLIYVDHEMQTIHGGEIIWALKAEARTAKIPTLYFSGHADIVELAKFYGADGFICKPFEVGKPLLETQKFLRRPAA